MSNIKTKAPYEYMESKQFKLFDFVPEFFEFCEYDDLSRFGCESIENNLIRLKKHGKILRIELLFVQVVSQKNLLKMELMNVNLFF